MSTPLDNLAAIFDVRATQGSPPSSAMAYPAKKLEEENKPAQDVIKSDPSPQDLLEKKRRSSNWDKGSPPRQNKESKFSDQPPKETASQSNLGPRPASSRFSEQPPVAKKTPPEHTNFSQKQESEEERKTEEGSFIYLLGVPPSISGQSLKQKLVQHFELRETDFSKTVTPYQQSKRGGWIENNIEQSCNYLRLQIADKATMNKMVMNPTFAIMNHPVLLLPEIADVPLEELINLHQVTFQPVNTQRAPYGGNPDEIAAIYRFVSKFGNVVDMNMERWPHHCLVTYASLATSQYLIKLKNVQYKNYKGYTVRLHTSTSPIYDANSVRNPIDLTEPFEPAKVYKIRSKNLQDKRTFPPPTE